MSNDYSDNNAINDGTFNTATATESAEVEISFYFVVFSSLLALVLLLSKLLHDRPKLASIIPEAGMILFVGIIAGSIASLFASSKEQNDNDDAFEDNNSNNSNNVADNLLSFSPNIFFLVLLPPIIFNSGYHIRRELFFRHYTPICLFAGVGTVISAVTIALILQTAKVHGLLGNDPKNITFTELLTFGGLVSATDPVSTLAVFQTKRVDPQLFYLVFGESVMNDAIGLVLFDSFSKFVKQNNQAEQIVMGIVKFGIDFVIQNVGSLCLGFGCGLASSWLLKAVDMRHTKLLELSLYILIMYVPFLIAEILHLSGIVTILFTGIAARRYVVPNLSNQTECNADVFFRLVAHLAETSIFLQLGTSVPGLIFFRDIGNDSNANNNASDLLNWKFVGWSILACLVGRALNVYPITYLYNWSLQREESGEILQLSSQHAPWLPSTSTAILPIHNSRDRRGNIEMSEPSDSLSSAREHMLGSSSHTATTSAINDSLEVTNNMDGTLSLTSPYRRDLKIHGKTAHMLWFSGLRGAVAYACANMFPNTFGHRPQFIVVTMMIVLVTVFALGGTTEKALQVLNIDINVDEDKYMEANYNEPPIMGIFSRFELNHILPFVIRDFNTGDREAQIFQELNDGCNISPQQPHKAEEDQTNCSLDQHGGSISPPQPRSSSSGSLSNRKEFLYDFGSR